MSSLRVCLNTRACQRPSCVRCPKLRDVIFRDRGEEGGREGGKEGQGKREKERGGREREKWKWGKAPPPTPPVKSFLQGKPAAPKGSTIPLLQFYHWGASAQIPELSGVMDHFLFKPPYPVRGLLDAS